jgi:hypothetical protein
MKARAEVVTFIQEQLDWKRESTKSKCSAHHYGRQDLRDLLDFIYGQVPQSDDELLPPPSSVSFVKHVGD